MKIDCYLSQSCGGEHDLRENIVQALAFHGMDAEVNFHRIDQDEASRLGLKGSPSVFIDGREVQPADVTGFS